MLSPDTECISAHIVGKKIHAISAIISSNSFYPFVKYFCQFLQTGLFPKNEFYRKFYLMICYVKFPYRFLFLILRFKLYLLWKRRWSCSKNFIGLLTDLIFRPSKKTCNARTKIRTPLISIDQILCLSFYRIKHCSALKN